MRLIGYILLIYLMTAVLYGQHNESGGFITDHSTSPPSVFDLRDYNGDNYVTSVKSQQGGTCWTHGTMASMESNMVMTGIWTSSGEEGEPDLAEYHLDWWNGFNDFYNRDNNPPSGGIPVHQGGDYMVASAYFARGDGAVRDMDGQSYSSPPDQYDPSYHYFYPRHIEFHVVGENYQYMDMIKLRVMQYGAIGTCMTWNGAFMSSDFTHYQPPDNSAEVNHSVAIIGWDDNKQTQAPQPGAWLCKNSHDTDWGFDGYFWLSYYDKYAGKHPEMGAVVFSQVEPFRYDYVYYHDYHGMRDTLENINEIFNKFTAARTEFLNAVSFYTASDSVSYSVVVFDTYENGSLSDTLSKMSGFVQYSGFHTYDLDSTVTLIEGDDFYLYLHFDRGGQPFDRTSEVPVLLGSELLHIVQSDASPGESYYMNGGNWQDFYHYDLSPWDNGTGNFCIKGLTTDTITSLSIGKLELQQTNQEIAIPLTAKNFYDIGSFSLTIQYDPAVLLFNGIDNEAQDEVFSASAADGILTLSWEGSAHTLDINHGKLCDILFRFNDGASDISFDEALSFVHDKNNQPVTVSYRNGGVHIDLSETVRYLVHQPGDLNFAIYNEGSIGTNNRTKEGPGITWENTNGCFVGGPLFGTEERGMTNGYLGSFGSFDNSLVNDLNNVRSDFSSGFLSNADFDRISEAFLNDETAADPYGVDIIQRTYSNAGDEYVLLLYGYINTTGQPLEDFYAGLFIDWDIGNYENDLGGYDTGNNLVYMHGNELDIYFGTAALTGLSGMRITEEFGELGNGTQIRQHSFDFISTSANQPVPNNNDLRSWQGTYLGTLPAEGADTLWACFAICAADNFSQLLGFVNQAKTKAESLGWTGITTKTDEPGSLPNAYKLLQNYPNPFNPSTRIRYELPEESKVTLEIFNSLGERVTVLVDEIQQAGGYGLLWNADGNASGVYIMKLTSVNEDGKLTRLTRKMLLLR